MKVEDARKFKKADKGLIEAVKQQIEISCQEYTERNELEEDFEFEYNGVMYDVYWFDETSWDDEGKYQYQTVTYQLMSYNKDIKGYISKDSIIDEFDLFIELPITRSGSYFSDYYYEYSKPSIMCTDIKHVPEQIIPAHDEVMWKYLDEER